VIEAPIPDNETQRLAALKALSILDTKAEERFDRIIKMAQWIFDVPISTLSLVDSNREWFKSCVGVDVKEGPRSISFCGHAMLEDELFVIPDTKADPRFADNPMVIGKPYIRFYAGQSLANAAGIKVGTFCIKDTKPRVLTEEQKRVLKDLALWAELEINSHDLSVALEERHIAEKALHQTLSDLSKANDELKQAQLQLFQAEKLASIGQLAAGVAHEINNPVGFISNNMEILQNYIANYSRVLAMVENVKDQVDRGDMEQVKAAICDLRKLEEEVGLSYIKSDVNKLLEHSARGLERIQRIVIDLRTFARSDTLESKEMLKIEEVIDSILSIVQSELKNKAELVKNYGDTPLLKCNPQRMGQVFINLLVNAAQAIPERGTITIKTYQRDHKVCIDIKDTGSGIPKENLQKIFDPFFTTKPVGQGTGLGLSVSYEIVKKHSGDLKVYSEVGKGTTLTVILPTV
jgi:two-component system, NtrC family, sensor kinase